MGSAVSKEPTHTRTGASTEESREPHGDEEDHETQLNDNDQGTLFETATFRNSNTNDATSNIYDRNDSNIDEVTDREQETRQNVPSNDGEEAIATDHDRNEPRILTTSPSSNQSALRQKYVPTPYAKRAKYKNTQPNVSQNENTSASRQDVRSSQASQSNSRNKVVISNVSGKHKTRFSPQSDIKASTSKNVTARKIKQISSDRPESDQTISDTKDNKNVYEPKLSEYSIIPPTNTPAQLKIQTEKSQDRSQSEKTRTGIARKELEKNSPNKSSKKSPKASNERPQTGIPMTAKNDINNTRGRTASAKESKSRVAIHSPKSANGSRRSQLVKHESRVSPITEAENAVDNNSVLAESEPHGTLPTGDSSEDPIQANDTSRASPKFNSESTKQADDVNIFPPQFDNAVTKQASDVGIVTPQFDHEEEVYTSLSLRSTTLDSRLFASDISEVTYSDYSETMASTDSLSDPTIRLKYGLMDWYRSNRFNVQNFPLLPASAWTYMPPWMTRKSHVESEDDLKELTRVFGEGKDNLVIDKHIRSFKQIFNCDTERKIFLVGDHGTGKTLFLKYVITCWLEEHMKKEMDRLQSMSTFTGTPMSELGIETETVTSLSRNDENHTPLNELLSDSGVESHDDFKYFQTFRQRPNDDDDTLEHTDAILEDSEELLKFKFLFYISLKYCKRHMDIREVIYKQYAELLKHLEVDDEPFDDLLREVLDNEPDKCLILIDDLDEWRPTNWQYKAHIKTNGLPSFDQHSKHTVIWTMTPSKLKQVNELMVHDFKVSVHGIDNSTSRGSVERVVKDLNSNRQKKPVKVVDIQNRISTSYLGKYERFPYTLQSLVRILYQFQVDNSMCSTWCQMLEMQFHLLKTWQDVIQRNKRKRNLPMDAWKMSKETHNVALPKYYNNLEHSQENKHIVYLLSKYAYTSWAQSVTWFGVGSLEASGMSQELIEICVQTGLLVRDDVFKSVPLANEDIVRITDRTVQMFLAATYITMLCLDEAYSNMGNIKNHSRKINALVDLHTHGITHDIDKLFADSDLIVFLSGLCPPLANRFIKDIDNTANKIEKIQKYRHTFLEDDRGKLLRDIQQLTFVCLHECLVTGEGTKEVYISDLAFDINHMKYMKYVQPEVVMSMDISFAGVENYDELSKFIFHGQQYTKLQKVVIRDETLKMTRADADLVLGLLQNCSQSLCTFSCVLNRTSPETYLRLTENMHRQLLNMTNLQALELAEMTLSHSNFSHLASVISTKLRLRQLRLVGINCDADKCEGEEHVLYLTEHANLEFLELEGREVAIGDLNAASLASCAICNMSPRTEFRIFDGLRHSKTIQSFTQTVPNRPAFVCKTLMDSLKTWVSIQRITLDGTNIADNEIPVESLPNLRRINLLRVQMTANGWMGFVISLLMLQQHLQVHTTDLIIRPDGTDISFDALRRPIHPEMRAKLLANNTEKEKALIYVKKRTNAFVVTLELSAIFNFETKQSVIC